MISGPYCINIQHLFLLSQLLNVHTRAHPGNHIIDKCFLDVFFMVLEDHIISITQCTIVHT